MRDLMAALREFLGVAAPDPAPTPDERPSNQRLQEWAEEKLRDQAARLRAMDAQVDAQRKSNEILHPRRRATDRP